MITILGLGADASIYGDVLTYPEQKSDPDVTQFLVELLFEGGLDISFGLVELLF
jgi:hypothetical protein